MKSQGESEKEQVDAADVWYGKISKLNVFKARNGIAPHKPLLLLVIFDMVESGELPEGALNLTPDLAFRFSVYGSVVAYRRSQALLVRFPFYHLKSEGFWHVLDEEGQPAADAGRAPSRDRPGVPGAGKGPSVPEARDIC